ncbi:MAG: SIS domain-containing protein [Planctomycetota bacterium]
MEDRNDTIRAEFAEAARVAGLLTEDREAAARVVRVADLIAERLGKGGKILAIGNGGSCADAVHFCEELTGRYRADRPSIGAVACSDAGHITCTGNDYGFDRIFARWIEGLGRPGDVLIALSTSGNSANVVQGVEAARARGLAVVLLLGKKGGKLAEAGDETWIVPGATADRIQELHMLILHSLVGAIERSMGFA